MTNLSALLFDHPATDDDLLLHSASRSMTAGEVRREVRRVADDLRAHGLIDGTGVAVQLPNDLEFVITMFAVWAADGVFIPINGRMPNSEADHVLSATAPALIVTEHDVHARPDPQKFDDGAAFVLFTSGTTGRPKPVVHAHENYLELLDRVLVPLRGGRDAPTRFVTTPNLIPVSLALNAGIYNVLFGLRSGAPIVIMNGFAVDEFAHCVRRFAIRSTVLPPAAIVALNDAPQIADLAPLKYVRSITAPLSPLQAQRFHDKFGVFVLNGYGQAEIGEVIGWTAADAREHPHNLGAVGRPHPGVTISIRDIAGHAVATGEVGALWVRPPSHALGLDGRCDEAGFVDTGDLARVADDGFVWVEGRAGDLINRGGNKVYPEQVEEVLCLLDGIREACVVGQTDDRLGEVPVAYIVVDPTATLGDDQIVEHCRAHLVAYKVPVQFERVDALPRSEIGKLLRSQLRNH